MQAHNKFTILLVDDCDFSLKAESSMLEQMGYEVSEAHNAYLALKILSKKQIDFVITDIEMPHISGDELSYLIHRRYPDLPILAVTSAERTVIKNTEHAQFKEILAKPLTAKKVLKHIEQINYRIN